jgi:O-antigen ligase
MNIIYKNYQSAVQFLLTSSIILSCFSVNLPTAWMSASTVLILSMFLLGGDFNAKFKKIMNHPSAVATLLFFAIIVLGVFYSSGYWDMKIKFFQKYTKLLLIPVILSSVSTPKIRSYGVYAFVLTAVFVLFISYGKWLHLLPLNLGIHDISSLDYGFAVYKNRIAHNIFMSFAMYVFLIKATRSQAWIQKIWGILATLAFFNVMYLVNGRSGQAICLVLLAYFLFKQCGKKAIYLILALFLSGMIFKAYLNPLIPERLLSITQEISDAKENHEMTSSGVRYVMYQSAMQIFLKSPIWGHGTGSLREEYRALSKENYVLNIEGMDNPHNQYLLILAELGLTGLLGFLYLFYSQWMTLKTKSLGKEAYIKDLSEGLIITILIGSLFNSLILDAGEGKFYCVMAGLFLSAFYSKKIKKDL